MELQFSCAKCGKFLGYYTGRQFYITGLRNDNRADTLKPRILCWECYQNKVKKES